MIVPDRRLLGWTALVGLPAATLATALPEATPVALLLIGCLLAVAALDATLSASRLDDLSLEAPPVLRFTADRDQTIPLRLRHAGARPRRLRIGLAGPAELAFAREELDAELPASTPLLALDWTLTPQRRGRYALGPYVLEERSALGLWQIRSSRPLASEVRVFPSLWRERRDLAALFLNRGMYGVHLERQVGKGREFEKLREYVAGDPTEDIHWKATARRGHPITKVHQLERTQEVYALIDASRLSARPLAADAERGAASEPLLDHYVSAALVLALAAERQGDRFGLIVYSNRVQSFVRAASGRVAYRACREALVTAAPSFVTPDFEELCGFVRTRLRRRALLVFLTSLDDPVLAQSFVKAVELVSSKHLLLAGMLRPPLARPLFEEPASSLEDIYRGLAGHLLWHDLRELEAALRRQGVWSAPLTHARLAAQLVTHYLNLKRRQLL